MPKLQKKKERAVICTTEFRGVFFGYADDTDGETISLKRSRNCIYWSADLRGFAGLAAIGPGSQCKIGPAVDIVLRKITSVIEVTPEAEAKWNQFK
jgi:hypothetical protein